MSTKGFRRTEIGIAGALIMLAQALTSRQSTSDLSHEIEKLRSDLKTVQANQDQFFVKKKELKKVVIKLDSMKDQLRKIQEGIHAKF